MTSKERLKATWNGIKSDRVPFTTWCFGVKPRGSLTWTRNGEHIERWYSLRMEHLHTWHQAWTLEDEFRRVLAWQSLGVDDTIDVSIPWSLNLEVMWKDGTISAGVEDAQPLLVREYKTPSGNLRHSVRKTGEDPGEGWVVQPDHVPLFEDFNIPRGVDHAVSSIEDVPKIQHLYQSPDKAAGKWFKERMEEIQPFAQKNAIAVQAWSAFGMDGVIWLTGVEPAVYMAIDHPTSFGKLVDTIAETDYGRTELACKHPGVDIVTQRGWYCSTDFWSPKLFDQFQLSHIRNLAKLIHKNGKKFGFVMTTGVEVLGSRLVEAGVDVLYFIDPVQDNLSVSRALELFGNSITLVGGTNSISLAVQDKKLIDDQVKESMDILGPTHRFILHPVDALHPDTPWEGIEMLIESYKENC